MSIPEPYDGTAVGFLRKGSVRSVYERDDRNGDQEVRWFPAHEDIDHALTWDELLKSHRHLGGPVRLVQEPLDGAS